MHLHTDGNDGLLVDERSDGRAALRVSSGVCDRPGCKCRRLLLRASQVERDDRKLAAPRFLKESVVDAQLEIDSGELIVDHEESVVGAARESLRWLREALDPATVQKLTEWGRSRLVERDRVRAVWTDVEALPVWRGWRPGDPASYEIAYSDPADMDVSLDERTYTLVDSYCVEAGCTCDHVEILVERADIDENADDGEGIVGSFWVSASKPDAMFDLDTEGDGEKLLRDVWRRALDDRDLGSLLRARGERMRPVGEWLHKNAVALAKPVPVRAAMKPGRNDPCPCGSGKKYKKCCGA